MHRLLYIILAIVVAFAGCWVCAQLLPPGAPRLVGEVLSVFAGFGLAFGGPRYFPID